MEQGKQEEFRVEVKRLLKKIRITKNKLTLAGKNSKQ